MPHTAFRYLGGPVTNNIEGEPDVYRFIVIDRSVVHAFPFLNFDEAVLQAISHLKQGTDWTLERRQGKYFLEFVDENEASSFLISGWA